ncbi:MAG TPA: hypothetical protein VFH78_10930 [Candidatus Thermoplasmatota archaeon]|nr:hypothetical protein [Candidatus Thermoplasmatota archaeon]
MAPAARALALAALLLSFALPTGGAAEGESLGVTPTEVVVSSAQRGETYVREVTLQNQFDTPSRFVLEREGEVGEWARVEPAEDVLLPPRTNERLRVVLVVPPETPNGPHEGMLRFVGAPKEQPGGSGFALRYAVAVPLHVDVGGDQLVQLRFLAADARDVEAGTPPVVAVGVTNEGNVRTQARATAHVLDAAGAEIASASNATRLRPGERGELRIPLPAPLPEGTYRVLVRPDDAPPLAETSFKVVPPGTLGKEGTLRFLQHEPSTFAGYPIRVGGHFENTGASAIARARLVGEAWQGDRLVGVFSSEELSVAAGESIELVAYFTSPVAGPLRLVAHVVYDGFRTPPNEGILVVGGAAGEAGAAWHPIAAGGVALGVLAAGGAAFALRRRR